MWWETAGSRQAASWILGTGAFPASAIPHLPCISSERWPDYNIFSLVRLRLSSFIL
jgi:hypothetical protein